MQQNVLVATARAQRGKSEIPRPGGLLAAVAVAALLAACASTGHDAPVVDRTAEPSAAVAVPSGQENAGKPGYYSVRPGDTISRIARETGQTVVNLTRWNNLENPNLIEIGQVLRVVPPVAGMQSAPAVSSAPVSGDAARVQSRPLASASPAPAVTPVAASAPGAAAPAPDSVAFSWPVSGSVLERFDEARNKGVDLSGKAGDPVLAAADGKVVYAGSGLRGYGNLIILKHNNTYLTAYAHNQTLLVKEDQTVRQGQKIAEMGSSDSERVKLHFEVRRNGKPVDPLKHLPAR